MLPKVLAVFQHCLAGHHRGVGHGEDAQKRHERRLQMYPQGRVVGGHEAGVADGSGLVFQYFAPENPAARRGRGGVEQAAERVHEVLRRDGPASAVDKHFTVMKKHPAPQHKRVGFAILRHGKAPGQRRGRLQGRIQGQQAVVELRHGPGVGLVARKGRVERRQRLGLVVAKHPPLVGRRPRRGLAGSQQSSQATNNQQIKQTNQSLIEKCRHA